MYQIIYHLASQSRATCEYLVTQVSALDTAQQVWDNLSQTFTMVSTRP